MKNENVALIGYGYWGKKIYRYLNECENFNLCYVYFPSLARLDINSIHREYGKEFTNSIKNIWEDEHIPNVVIVTPINTHYFLVHEALLNSKNVLVEKPLTTSIEEAHLLKKIASERNLKLLTEYTYTFSRALLYAKKLIDEGGIGLVKSIYITIKQLGRFLEYDVNTLLGTHALSILDIFLPIGKCTFHLKPLYRVGSVVTAGIIQFEAKEYGCGGYIDVTLHSPDREKKVVIYGEKGTIIYNPCAENTLRVVLYSCERSNTQEALINKQMEYHFDENHNLQYSISSFYEVINNQSEHNIERATAVTAVLESLSKT